MKSIGRNLAEAAAFGIAMLILAWFRGDLVLEGAARPLWFQLTTRFVIYAAIFFVISLGMDALFKRREKK